MSQAPTQDITCLERMCSRIQVASFANGLDGPSTSSSVPGQLLCYQMAVKNQLLQLAEVNWDPWT